jgi:hypothetical protein
MNRSAPIRITEARLTSGLARLYRNGYGTVLVLMLLGLLYSVAGWEPALIALKAGIVVLLSIPVISVVWVGIEALRQHDRPLLYVVLGLVALLIMAGVIPLLQ